MNTGNVGNTSSENPQVDPHKGTTSELLRESVKKICNSGSAVCSPILLNDFDAGGSKRDEVIESIKKEMELQRKNNAEFTHISDRELSGLMNNTVEIHIQFEKIARPLRNTRKEGFDTLIRTFRNLNQNQKEEIKNELLVLDENEIQTIIDSRASMKRFLQGLGYSIADLMFWNPDLSELFDTENLPDELKKRTKKAIELHNTRGQGLPIDLIRDLVGYFAHGDNSKIKKICREFGCKFTIREGISSGMVSAGQLELITKNEYGTDVWDSLSKEQKDELIHLLKTDDTYKLTIEELEEFNSRVSDFLSNKVIKKIISDKVVQSVGEIQENNNGEKPKLSISFADFIESSKTNGVGTKIKDIESLEVGKILALKKTGIGGYVFLELDEIDKELPVEEGLAGATFSLRNGVDGTSFGGKKGQSTLSYETLEKWIQSPSIVGGQVFTLEEVRTQVENGFFTDERGETIQSTEANESEVTIEYLRTQINAADPDGKSIPVDIGMAFIADATTEKGDSIRQTFTIKEIKAPNLTISNGLDNETVSFTQFVQLIGSNNFKRIANLKDDASFLEALSSFGVGHGTTLKDHKLITETEKDDGHGHHKKVETQYEYFRAKDGTDAHIRVNGIDGDRVLIWEWSSDTELKKVAEAKTKKKLSKGTEKSMYTMRVMSRAAFIAYLKENSLQATTDDLLDAHAGYHPHDPHMHSSAFGSLFKGVSINDMVKGFGNIVHGWEHYFEKNSKLNASRFALKMGRTFGFPADIMAQLQADEVSSVKEVIEKIQDKLFNLNGPVARNKALHIAKLTSSSPEEVGAAMIYMVKSYGHLYAEDISYAQGSESFVNGFLYSLGWRNIDEVTAMKRKARDKFLADLGSGSDGGEPTEEEIIWGLLKIIDGGAAKKPGDKGYDPRFANAGTVVKAMGGPSGWEKAWRTEGMENAYQKGIRQGGAVVNAKGRVNKGLSAFKTHELNTAIGFMEKAAGKTPHPSMQVIPIIWCLGGYSKYSSTEMLQRVKGFGDSQGHTFHAYSFTRNEEDNEKYRNAFILALKDIDIVAAGEAKKHIENLLRGPAAGKDLETAIVGLDLIWTKYWNKGLHDHLQGKDTWIAKKVSEGDITVQTYAKRLAEVHFMNSKTNPPGNDNGWWDQGGYFDSPQFGDNAEGAFRTVDGKQVLYMTSTLNKLKTDGSYDIESDSKKRIWAEISQRFEVLKKESDEDLKRAQYKQYREEILQFFRDKMGVRTRGEAGAISEIQRKSYYPDLLKMGIDPADFFTNTGLGVNAERDYQKWSNGGASGTIMTQGTVEDMVAAALKGGSANDSNYRRT